MNQLHSQIINMTGVKRKDYAKPKLTAYGSVHKLTQSGNNTFIDNSTSSNNRSQNPLSNSNAPRPAHH
jgi:hypothetical protein